MAGSDGACVASPGSSGRRAASAIASSVGSKFPKGRPVRLSSAQGTVAVELLGSAAPRLHQSPLPSSGSAFHGEAGQCLIRRTAMVRTRMPGGVGGAASRDVPLSRLTGAGMLLQSLQLGRPSLRLPTEYLRDDR